MIDVSKELLQIFVGTLKELLDSKKFVASFGAAIVAVLVGYFGKKGIVLDPALAKDLVNTILLSSGGYVLSQAAADLGKSKAEATIAAVAAGTIPAKADPAPPS